MPFEISSRESGNWLERWEIEIETQRRYLCKRLSDSLKTHIFTEICGTQWRELCQCYGIEEGDVVTFTWNEDQHVFDVEVTNEHNAAKPFVQHTSMLVCVLFLTCLVVYKLSECPPLFDQSLNRLSDAASQPSYRAYFTNREMSPIQK